MDGSGKRPHGFFKWRCRIKAMRIENINIIETKPLQALVEARQHIFTAAKFSVGARPHQIAGLGGNDEFIAVARKIRLENLSRKSLRLRPVAGHNYLRGQNG